MRETAPTASQERPDSSLTAAQPPHLHTWTINNNKRIQMLSSSLLWYFGNSVCTPVSPPALCHSVGASCWKPSLSGPTFVLWRCLTSWPFLACNINNFITGSSLQWTTVISTKATEPYEFLVSKDIKLLTDLKRSFEKEPWLHRKRHVKIHSFPAWTSKYQSLDKNLNHPLNHLK